MKQYKSTFICLLITSLIIGAVTVLQSKPVQIKSLQPIPLEIKGKIIYIRKNMSISEVKAALSALISDEASVDSIERLQYDIQLVPDEGPVTIAFDFNKRGMLSGVVIDSQLKEQNPPVTALLIWLNKNAGKPVVRKKGSIIWNFEGWRIEHIDRGSGEDSVYRIDFTALK